MAEKAQETTSEVRRLTPDDLDAAVAIDRAIVGDPRRGYFEKRLAAALRQPRAHLQFGIDGPDGLEACVFARVLSGEFFWERCCCCCFDAGSDMRDFANEAACALFPGLQGGDEGFLRNLDLAVGPHPLLARLLLL